MRTRKHDSVGFCESLRQYLASLIHKKDYAAVVEHYEANRDELARIGGSEAAEILCLASKAYASLAHYPVALKVARVAQHMIAEDGDSILLAEIFLTLGGILRDMGEHKEAEKTLRDAESIFRRRDSLKGQSRALNLLAGLFFRNNDYKNSLTILMDAIAIARRLDDKPMLAFMLGNIGRIHTFMGDFREARRHLKLNIDLSTERGDFDEVARAWLSLGYVHIQEADYFNAEEALNEADLILTRSGHDRDRVTYLTYLGELRYRRGELDDALEVLHEALQLAERIGSGTTLVGRVLRHLVEAEVLTGNLRMARRHCADGERIMKKANNLVELGALLRLKATMAEASGNKNKAAQLFDEALDMQAKSRVRFEHALTLVAAGRSEAYDARRRMTYLFRADDFYARHGLEKCRVQVERLINEIDYRGPVVNGTGSTKRSQAAIGCDFMTTNRAIVRFMEQLPLIGRADLPVLLTGETGVGKDHMARFYHQVNCADRPFVAINCASLPETLLESELFGYRKGAFTGADGDKPGLFVAANGGVLFLDEIGDMPLALQTKLLGVLENRKLIPLGCTREIAFDARIVAATNHNLEEMVERGGFRRDLYYRLSGVAFEIPPLRRRKEDIPLLFKHFMTRCNLIKEAEIPPPELVRQFIEYDWPGNTRELFNKVRRLEVMAQMVAEGDLVELSHSMFQHEPASETNTLFEKVEQFERQIIEEALLAARGNKSEVARMLGIHEATVRTKLKRYGISLQSCH